MDASDGLIPIHDAVALDVLNCIVLCGIYYMDCSSSGRWPMLGRAGSVDDGHRADKTLHALDATVAPPSASATHARRAALPRHATPQFFCYGRRGTTGEISWG
jgi:hypothetical protein